MHHALWHRLDVQGSDEAGLDDTLVSPRLTGRSAFEAPRGLVRLAFEIRCDAGWNTRSVAIAGTAEGRSVSIQLHADGSGRWHRDGIPQPQVEGCLDIDLGWSPATNLLPIRRLALSLGAGAEVSSAWLSYPGLKLQRLEQRYRHETAGTYLYDSPAQGYTARLLVDAQGFVLHYPGLWSRVERGELGVLGSGSAT
jgi:hypothetical protein